MKPGFRLILFAVIACITACNNASSQSAENPQARIDSSYVFPQSRYHWLGSGQRDTVSNIYLRFDSPQGCARINVETGSFGEWLRYLPLHPEDHSVLLYNGEKKRRQDVHAAVINIDVGSKDLQQCADAVMRLRSEYLFSTGRYDEIHFNYTSGDKCDYTEWSSGIRLRVKGNNVNREQTNSKKELNDRTGFGSYLQNVFLFAGSLSLSREMVSVPLDSMQIGDVFIYGGTPGHAVIVVDMCENESGEKYFMIAQSYMPAQEIHVLKNLNDSELSPWYPMNFGEVLETPEWEFGKDELKRFR